MHENMIYNANNHNFIAKHKWKKKSVASIHKVGDRIAVNLIFTKRRHLLAKSSKRASLFTSFITLFILIMKK